MDLSAKAQLEWPAGASPNPDVSVFWRHQAEGLTLFLWGQGFRSRRLPLRFEELAVVADHCHARPLLSLAREQGESGDRDLLDFAAIQTSLNVGTGSECGPRRFRGDRTRRPSCATSSRTAGPYWRR